jgi:Flp pilus assembly protein TadD
MFLRRVCLLILFHCLTLSAQWVSPGARSAPDNQDQLFRHPQNEDGTEQPHSFFERLNRTRNEPDVVSNTEGTFRSGTLSVAELRHPPSRAEVIAVQRAQRYAETGEHAKAITILEKALIPDNTAMPYVRSLLGIEYLRSGDLNRAVTQLKEAVILLPSLAVNHSNLGYVLCQIGNRQAGDKELREALVMDGKSSKAHFVLGVVLLDGSTSEARDHLLLAKNEVTMARLVLAVYYARVGEGVVAQEALASYLQANPQIDSAGASLWVANIAGLLHPSSAFGFKSPELMTSGT